MCTSIFCANNSLLVIYGESMVGSWDKPFCFHGSGMFCMLSFCMESVATLMYILGQLDVMQVNWAGKASCRGSIPPQLFRFALGCDKPWSLISVLSVFGFTHELCSVWVCNRYQMYGFEFFYFWVCNRYQMYGFKFFYFACLKNVLEVHCRCHI